ncbi:hypothetical protein [Actinophytocola sp.]|uniref:hypothetical protein n=1 Tax=Actinophytocola sp. TaxID=1872138 RepID=UPI002ED5D43B
MKDALNAMMDAAGYTGGRGAEIDRLVQDDLNVSLSLDPNKIEEEWDRLRTAAFEIGEDAEVIVKVNEAEHMLNGWHGAAANAFRDQLGRIRTFVTVSQYQATLNALHGLGSLYALAYHMRQNYYDLAVAVRSWANQEIDQQQVRDNKLKLAIGKELLLALMAMNPATAVPAGLVFFVEGITAASDQSIEGTGVDTVIDAYRDRSIGLRETFQSSLNQLTSKIRGDWTHSVENESDLKVMEPLPPVTDVSSPDFRYEAFATEEYPPGGPFAQQVEPERKRYAQEEAEQESEINKRLKGKDQ